MMGEEPFFFERVCQRFYGGRVEKLPPDCGRPQKAWC